MPTARIVPGRYAVPDAARDLYSQNEGMQGGGTRTSLHFGQCQDRRRHRRSRVDDRAQMRVVIVEKIGARRVDETCTQDIDAFRAQRPGPNIFKFLFFSLMIPALQRHRKMGSADIIVWIQGTHVDQAFTPRKTMGIRSVSRVFKRTDQSPLRIP